MARRPRPSAAGPTRRWETGELALVNAMDRSPDPLVVATAAVRHAALTRRPTPDYFGALQAAVVADVVLAALYRRGMLAERSGVTGRPGGAVAAGPADGQTPVE
jgi:hypothetical protein